jgi:hypothetical protein
LFNGLAIFLRVLFNAFSYQVNRHQEIYILILELGKFGADHQIEIELELMLALANF